MLITLLKKSLILVVINLVFSTVVLAEGPAKFSVTGLEGWERKSFEGQTDYQMVEEGGLKVLKAVSNNSASGLFYKQRIDLDETPWINWRWKISSRITDNNEQQKSGDDYSARIYVVTDGGMLRWRSKALNYIWSSGTELERSWPNAFLPRNAMMLATRTANDPLDTWLSEKRNVKEDLKKVYGKEIRYIDVVALMTDTDNTGQQLTAWYGDIHFSAE